MYHLQSHWNKHIISWKCFHLWFRHKIVLQSIASDITTHVFIASQHIFLLSNASSDLSLNQHESLLKTHTHQHKDQHQAFLENQLLEVSQLRSLMKELRHPGRNLASISADCWEKLKARKLLTNEIRGKQNGGTKKGHPELNFGLFNILVSFLLF